MVNGISNKTAIACAVGLAALAMGAGARAHDPGLSSLTLTQGPAAGAFSWLVDDAALPEARRATSPACDASSVLGLAQGGKALAVRARCVARDGHTAYEGTFAVPHGGQLTITAPLLDELARGHRSYARAFDGDRKVIAQRLLERGDRWQVMVADPSPARAGTVALIAIVAVTLTLAFLPPRRPG